MNILDDMHLPLVNVKEELEQISKNYFQPIFNNSQFEIREEAVKDKGIDYSVELKYNGKYSGFRFNVQLKATSKGIKNIDGSYSLQINTSNINYLLNSAFTSYYILYVHPENTFYYEYLPDFIKILSKKDTKWKKQPSHVLRFYKKLNPFTCQKIYDLALKNGKLFRRTNEKFILKENLPKKDKIKIENKFSKQINPVLKLKEKLLSFQTQKYHLKQSNYNLEETLDEIINGAKELEAFSILSEALTEKKFLKTNIKEFEKLNEEILFYDYCKIAIDKAADIYYKLILNRDFITTVSKKGIDKYLNSSVKEIEIDYKKTKSQQVNYYLHVIKMALCERNRNYTLAIDHCDYLIRISEKSKAVYRKERMGMIYNSISEFKTHIGDYKSAAIQAKKASTYYTSDSLVFMISKEMEFYAYMYSNDAEKSMICIKELLKHSLIDNWGLRSKYLYYQACILFNSEHYKEAYDLIKTSLKIEQETRWSITIRILLIMIFIKLNRIDEASKTIEALRKRIERKSRNEELKPRDVLITKLFMELEKDGFFMNPNNVSIRKMVKELSEKDTIVSWEVFSTELIPFHNWMNNNLTTPVKRSVPLRFI